jgi:hypothetical protein
MWVNSIPIDRQKCKFLPIVSLLLKKFVFRRPQKASQVKILVNPQFFHTIRL